MLNIHIRISVFVLISICLSAAFSPEAFAGAFVDRLVAWEQNADSQPNDSLPIPVELLRDNNLLTELVEEIGFAGINRKFPRFIEQIVSLITANESFEDARDLTTLAVTIDWACGDSNAIARFANFMMDRFAKIGMGRRKDKIEDFTEIERMAQELVRNTPVDQRLSGSTQFWDIVTKRWNEDGLSATFSMKQLMDLGVARLAYAVIAWADLLGSTAFIKTASVQELQQELVNRVTQKSLSYNITRDRSAKTRYAGDIGALGNVIVKLSALYPHENLSLRAEVVRDRPSARSDSHEALNSFLKFWDESITSYANVTKLDSAQVGALRQSIAYLKDRLHEPFGQQTLIQALKTIEPRRVRLEDMTKILLSIGRENSELQLDIDPLLRVIDGPGTSTDVCGNSL